MKLVHPKIRKFIEIEENYVNVVTIENKKFFTDTVTALITQTQGEEDPWVLSKENTILKIKDNLAVITDFFSLNFQNRKITTELYKRMEALAYSEDFFTKTQMLKQNILSYMYALEDCVDMAIYEEEDILLTNIFKAIGVKVADESLTFLEKIANYTDILVKYLGIKVVVFVNLNALLSQEDMEALYKDFFYKKINVVFLESSLRNIKIRAEKHLLIDEDLCEIW